LAVHPPAGDGRPADTVLGYVRVVEARVAESTVDSMGFADTAPAQAGALPAGSRCEVVSAGVETPGLRLAVVGPDSDAIVAVRRALDALPGEVRAVIDPVSDPASAEWWLVASADAIRLRVGAGVSPGPEADWSALLAPDPRGLEPVVRVYDPGPHVASELAPDLAKVARWQDLWRVLDPLANPPGSGGSGPELRLELFRRASPDDPAPAPLGADGLAAGEWLEIHIVNEGRRDLWVSVLYLDARFRIAEISAASVRRRERLKLKPMRMSAPFGGEGLVALGLPQREYRERPDFGMLAQEPLGDTRPPAATKRGGPPPSAFVGLLDRASARGQTREMPRVPRTDPLVATARWITAPRRIAADSP
jgi:hypothetical protein